MPFISGGVLSQWKESRFHGPNLVGAPAVGKHSATQGLFASTPFPTSFRSNTKISELLMDREPCRHRWYEQASGGENTTDVCAGYDNRPVLCLRLEPKSSVKPPVASSCPVPRSVATVHVGWGVWDRHLALMAQIERARGRPSSGSLPVFSVLDPPVLYHLRPSWLHFLGWCTRSRSSLEG